MKISVAMATYNGEKYIERQLDSIRMQTREVDEVIICDDQSKDRTVEVIEKYIEQHQLQGWSVSVNEENKGFIGNFFGVLKRTTGDYIFLCDQDDEWALDKIEKMVAIMEQDKNIQALNAAVQLIDGEGKKIPIKKRRGYCNANILHMQVKEGALIPISVPFLVNSNVSPGCTMCITRKLKDVCVTYANMCVETKFPHDWFLNIMAAKENGTYFYNEASVYYRIHEENTIGVTTEQEESGKVNSTKKLKQDIGKFHLERAVLLDEKLDFQENDKTFIKKYRAFAEKRNEFLQDFSLRRLLAIYRYPKIYLNSVEWKGMVSDVLYALHLADKLR